MVNSNNPADLTIRERGLCLLSGVLGVALVTLMIALGGAVVYAYTHVPAVEKAVNWTIIVLFSLFGVVLVGSAIYDAAVSILKIFNKWQTAQALRQGAHGEQLSARRRIIVLRGGEVLAFVLVEATLVPLWVQVVNRYLPVKPEDHHNGLWLVAFFFQLIVTCLGMSIWFWLDKRPSPDQITRTLSMLTLSILPLWALSLRFVVPGGPNYWVPLAGLIGGVTAMVAILGAAFGCERNLFDIVSGKPKPLHSQSGEV